MKTNKFTPDVISAPSLKKTLTYYEPVSHHIYFTGTSYRVRIRKDTILYNKTLNTKRKAIMYRNQLMKTLN